MKERYQFADILVDAEFNFEYLGKQCVDYRVSNAMDPHVVVSVSLEDVALERNKDDEKLYSDGYYESLAFYRKFCASAADFDCILFHGSALSVDGIGFLFGAPSGTGKSTHARLYRNLFGERVTMVNDDKPLLRVLNDQFYIYGTPWDGKHRLSNNISVPLNGICFLKQGPENKIRKLSVFEALGAVLGQVYRPDHEGQMRKVFALVQQLVQRVPIYELYCTISEEAVWMSYNTLKGDLIE